MQTPQWIQKKSFLCGAGIILGLVGVLVLTRSLQENTCSFDLINPTRCENEEAFKNTEYGITQKEVQGYIAQQKHAGVLQTSVYFRDLRNGPTFSLDADSTYIGASLLKLPILLQYMKEAETNPELLTRKVRAQIEPSATNQGLPAEQTLEVGKEYSIAELLERMISFSDNNSRAALIRFYQGLYPDRLLVLDTLENLGFANVRTDENGTYISVRSTASIFRILYNASYLNSEYSQKALQYLTNTAYDDGIAKPIPKDVRVANKYGIYNTTNEKELHDCGIVFYPEHPYVLCVMTRGKEIQALQDTIVHISETLYKEVSRRFPSS